MDKRLNGTWKSDRKRTFRHFKPKEKCPPKSFRAFKSLFGKLQITWKRKNMQTLLDGQLWTTRYEVVAKNASSVVVKYHDTLLDIECLVHVHFHGDYYWIALGGGNLCEWFRRIQ